MKKRIVLLGLNEINFQYIEKYIAKGFLPNFKRIFASNGYKRTISEKEYRLWEPWIQWVSIHTGKMYDEHKIFRLGDIVDHGELEQLWEIAERQGLKIGAISPFNAKNNLKAPAFFVPDPWTQTPAVGTKTLTQLSDAVSSFVNNNATNKISMGSVWALLKGFVAYVPLRKYSSYANLVMLHPKRKSTKPCVLDNVLSDTFMTLWKRNLPDFASLFLNSGAHIQHHYMFNSIVYEGDQRNPEWYCPSKEDPLLDILEAYDSIIGELLSLNVRLFIATGLHQKPHVHNTFYWRLKEHEEFLKLIYGGEGIVRVIPRMSRDFLVECSSEAYASKIESLLNSVKSADEGLGIFSVDNRGKSLFIELIYSKEIKGDFKIKRDVQTLNLNLTDFVSFVAIKNGEHDGEGYFLDSERKYSHVDSIPVSEVFNEIKGAFSAND